MEAYDWPGNLRELEHRIVSAMSRVSPETRVLNLGDLEMPLLPKAGPSIQTAERAGEAVPEEALSTGSLRQAVQEYERRLIQQALEAAGGNVSKAARSLEIPRQTLCRKIRGYGL